MLVTGQAGERRFSAHDGALKVNLPPGSYAVHLRAEGRTPVDRALTVLSTEAVHLDAVLPRQIVRIEGDRVVLSERIYFETGSAVLARRSFPLLDQVASTLLQHPEVKGVAIRGHTDDVGEADFNLDLSLARAQSVQNYLVQSGVPKRSLQAYGLGESQPLVLGDTAEARAANRRVEFLITQRTKSSSNEPNTNSNTAAGGPQ